MGRYKELVAEYKQKAKRKYELLKKQRQKRRGLPLKEQWQLLLADRKKRLNWKHRIAKLDDAREKYAQKKGYKYYRKLQHRKYKWGATTLVVLVLGGLLTNWFIQANKPLTDEQKVAREASLSLARQVMDESMILLKNEHATLPLKSTKVNIFGTEAVSPIYSGGGAGGMSSASAEGFYPALKAAHIPYNEELYNVYGNYAHKKKASTAEFKEPGKNIFDILLPNAAGFLAKAAEEMPPSELPDEVLKNAKAYSDTALYVISRAGTETIDFKPEELRLTENERATLKVLNDHFAHIVVILNTTNVMELGFLDEFSHIDSALWIGAPGEVGMYSVVAALKGDVSPSGRLTDTYAYAIESNPSVVNTGNFQYKDSDGQALRRYFMNYQENIYVGYRYFETLVAEDDYDKVVQYPFGYGLSYTQFDWNVEDTKATAEAIRAKVRVTNTGDKAGKDVVQVYYRAPYHAGGVEKSAVVLAGYTKTKTLQPGESEAVEVTFTPRDMASFDEAGAKTWVLEAGVYTIAISRNVHEPVAQFDYTAPETVIYNTDSRTGAPVTTRFQNITADAPYLSRSNPVETAPTAPTADMFTISDSVIAADYKHTSSGEPEPTTDADVSVQLAELKNLTYDDPKWQTFLDQLTPAEMIRLAGHGGYWSTEIERLGVPRTSMYDGPSSIRNFLTAWATVAYPAPLNLASTWNDTLSEETGRAMGKEAQSFNVDAAYAPSLNMHRSPLGGRNFEYYSEDPLLAGKTGAAYIRGLQSTGTVAVMKHFAANDQETNRANYGLYTWLTEQSLRELYLKPFEIAVKEGNAHGAMSAFNRIGATWAGGDKALLTDVLRTEWGFKGFVITDAGLAGQGDHFNALQAVEAGNDMMLASIIDVGQNGFEKQLKKYLEEDRAGTLNALRNASHNILYYVLQTSKL